MTCDVCGPLPPDKDGNPVLHDRCHDQEHTIDIGGRTLTYTTQGCGHSLDRHSQGMKCGVCKRDCGHTDTEVRKLREQYDAGQLFA